jgi:hypothetical protein
MPLHRVTTGPSHAECEFPPALTTLVAKYEEDFTGKDFTEKDFTEP